MRKIFIISSVAFCAACNNSGDKAKVDSMSAASDSTAAATTPAPMTAINSPYPVLYSSKFEIGEPKYAETILALWKDWDNGTLMNSKDRFADTVNMHFSNGGVVHASRDSALTIAQAERNKIAKSVSRVDAVMSAKSTMNNMSPRPEDQTQNWALIWGMETDTDKKGKVDSSYLQETWGFDKNGKVSTLYQFRAAAAPPKKK